MKLPTLDAERNRNHGPMWKKPIASPVVRQLKTRKAKGAEDEQKAKVRRRDKYCRFPLCGCGKFKLQLEVSHGQHKGAGGNPKGDRSAAKLMILLCSARHLRNRISLHRATLRVRALNPRQGLGGPVAWDVDGRALAHMVAGTEPVGLPPKWIELARETARHVYEPFTDAQQQALDLLATMTF